MQAASDDGTTPDGPLNSENPSAVQSRRRLLALAASGISAVALISGSSVATAYDKTYPVELDARDADPSRDERQRRVQSVLDREQSKKRRSLLGYSPGSKAFGTVLWAGALWLLTGSRSNPLVTPLANALYDEEEEAWLKDRNEGLFSNLPFPLFAALAIVFFAVGSGFDSLVTFLADGDRDNNLQLAGVSLIAGGALELGRIAAGEKKQTREESDRDMQLEREFNEFASNRLKPGGNCHRNEVTRAFRRYYAKYRQADHPEYGLSDVEVERLLRNWSRPLGGVEMSSAGFYSGVQINQDADVFKATR